MKKMYIFISFVTVIATMLLYLNNSWGSTVQVITFRDGGSDMVDVSQREINIIRLPSSDVKIVTNSNNIDIKIMGENALMQFVGEPQPTSLVLLSKKGIHTLTVIPRGIPSATIVIKDEVQDKGEAHEWEISHSYIDVIKKLIKSMYQETPPSGYKVEKTNKPVTPLWEGTTLVHQYRYYGASLIGDVYEFKNIGQHQITVKPSEFYTKGVLAVSVDTETLAPGQSTKVYIVRYASDSKAEMFKAIKFPLR